MSFDLDSCRRFAERLARESGQLLLDFQDRVTPREKGPSDLVTEADYASQRLIASRIAETYPDHSLLAEEEGVVADPTKDFRWIVDPLDGTINYAHKLPFWCVSIGLEWQGELVVGVIHDPASGRLFSASRGGGAALNDRPIRVSSAPKLSSSLISTGMPTNFAGDVERQLALMAAFSVGTHSVRRTGSSALNLAYVAAGSFEVFYATSIHPWDVAAGILIAREAGGSVSRLDGLAYDFEKSGILATNGLVHAEAVALATGTWPSLLDGGLG